MENTASIPGIHIREAGEGDIPLIRSLAESIWREHYPPIIGTEQVEYMLKGMYATRALRQQMLTEGHIFFLCYAGAVPVGFFSLHLKTGGSGFIHKFYLLREYRGKGVAAAMMEIAVSWFRQGRCAEIRLQVNRMNTGPVNFYFKQGFHIEKAADFDIGAGFFMKDFIMLRRLQY